MKRGDRVPLRCGHQGRVVWISDDDATVAVRGSRRSCPGCYKNRVNPTVFLITMPRVDAPGE
jgi:hypothetical protein